MPFIRDSSCYKDTPTVTGFSDEMKEPFSRENNFTGRVASGHPIPTLQVRDSSQRPKGAPNSFASKEGIQITVKNGDLARERVRGFICKLN